MSSKIRSWEEMFGLNYLSRRVKILLAGAVVAVMVSWVVVMYAITKFFVAVAKHVGYLP